MDVGNLRSIVPLSPLEPLGPISPPVPATTAPGSTAGGSFQNILGQVLGANSAANVQADQAIQALATGEAQDLHKVALAVSQADLTFRLILEMRNRLTEAYQEVTRMQI